MRCKDRLGGPSDADGGQVQAQLGWQTTAARAAGAREGRRNAEARMSASGPEGLREGPMRGEGAFKTWMLEPRPENP